MISCRRQSVLTTTLCPVSVVVTPLFQSTFKLAPPNMNVALPIIFAIIIKFITTTPNFSLENATFTRVITESLTNTTQQLKLEFHLQNVLKSTSDGDVLTYVNFKCISFRRFRTCWENLENQYGNVRIPNPDNPHRRSSNVAINPNLSTIIQLHR